MRAIASGRLVGFLASFLGYLLQVVGPSSDSVCIQPLTTLPALTEAALPPWRLLAGTGTGIPRNSNSQEEGSVRHLRMYKKLPPPQTGGFGNKGLWCLHESVLFRLHLGVPVSCIQLGAGLVGAPPHTGQLCWVLPEAPPSALCIPPILLAG